MNYYLSNIDELRSLFFAQLKQEYDLFRNYIMRQPVSKVYDTSLKITFYREVYRYLRDDVLKDNEYESFVGENIIEKLWDIFVVTELPRQTRDYLRQLIKLLKENNARGAQCQETIEKKS